jgi:glycosyltransferase involved in cell wall biosynthesis
MISAVVPFKDEAESLPSLHVELLASLEGIGEPWEIVYVDDGSTDGSLDLIKSLARDDSRVRFLSLDRNYGQSTALVAGAEAASGTWIAGLDADGQNDPADLVELWALLRSKGVDAVQGVRRERHDSWMRKASSRIANRTRDVVTGDSISDVGCSLRIVRRSALLAVPRFEGMHRFLPTLLRMTGATLVEQPVSHRPRSAGKTKYGVRNRLWKGLYDLIMVRRLKQRWIQYRLNDASEEGSS